MSFEGAGRPAIVMYVRQMSVHRAAVGFTDTLSRPTVGMRSSHAQGARRWTHCTATDWEMVQSKSEGDDDKTTTYKEPLLRRVVPRKQTLTEQNEPCHQPETDITQITIKHPLWPAQTESIVGRGSTSLPPRRATNAV